VGLLVLLLRFPDDVVVQPRALSSTILSISSQSQNSALRIRPLV
jgi:hypothetical protein